MGTTEKLAKFIVDFDFSKLPASGMEQMKISLLDTLGTALVGSTRPMATIMSNFVKKMGGNPQARLIGSGMKTNVLDAALANGSFAHYEDYDDVDDFGHPAVVLTPPVIALGEQLKVSGKKIMEAYAVGFEVGSKIRNGLGMGAARKGFHMTSLFGTMAAAAETAKLLGLNVAQTRAAMGISASMASGIMQNFGTYTKPMHPGHTARCGMMAGILAKDGFTGDPDVLEGRLGFFYVFGDEHSDIRRVTENIGNPLAIASHHVFIKAWPCCLENHLALTAMFNLIEKYDVKPEQVEAIDVVRPGKGPGPSFRNYPKIGLEGKFSVQYNMATALVDRRVDVNSHTDEKLARPMIQDLIKKVTRVQHPDFVDLPLRLEGGQPNFAIVTLRLKDGRILSERVEQARELKGEEVYAKYQENARIGGIGKDKIERTIELIKGLENLKDVTELVDTVVS
jgi:2-methylcitrate dehydratase PrpD